MANTATSKPRCNVVLGQMGAAYGPGPDYYCNAPATHVGLGGVFHYCPKHAKQIASINPGVAALIKPIDQL